MKEIEKQTIEEIARAMCRNCMANGNCATDDEPCALECVYGFCAERLYCKGYRKQIEGEWIIKGLANPKCSACNSYNRCGDKSDFCPNCGAHMKGGAE